MRLLTLSVVVAAVAGFGWMPARAAEPETFEPGTGKYILVLKDPRTDIIDPATGKKKAQEPDVAKHGGKVLHKKEAVRIVKMPVAKINALRMEENVAYVQRVWLGESLEGWDDNQQSSALRAEPDPTTLETDLTWTTGTYAYDGSGNIKQIGGDTYRYDSAGRLIRAVVKGTSASYTTETYKYDSFGNLTEKTIGAVPGGIAVDSSSNRLQGETYDAAGNLTTQRGTPTYNYDSMSMMDQVDKPVIGKRRILYGPDDERIGVIIDDSLSRWKVRDFSGKVLREYKSDDQFGIWTWMEDYVYGEGRLIGADREAYYGGKRHFHTDHLGSVRMITDQNRLRRGVHDYLPFGVEQTDSVQEYTKFAPEPTADSRSDPMKFTSHERDFHGVLNYDNTDYLDYMHARYYDPNLGRFLSVDPTWESAGLHRPQSWNRYSYVTNNPINLTDPDGKNPFWWLVEFLAEEVVSQGVTEATHAVKQASSDYVRQRQPGSTYARPHAVPAVFTDPRAALIARNAAQGRAFENAVLSALGATKNWDKVSGTYRGGSGRSIPDILVNGRGMVEIKSSQELSLDKQLQVQYTAALRAGVSMNLVVSPQTQSISAPLQNAVRITGGKIFVYDPTTKEFRDWVPPAR